MKSEAKEGKYKRNKEQQQRKENKNKKKRDEKRERKEAKHTSVPPGGAPRHGGGVRNPRHHSHSLLLSHPPLVESLPLQHEGAWVQPARGLLMPLVLLPLSLVLLVSISSLLLCY